MARIKSQAGNGLRGEAGILESTGWKHLRRGPPGKEYMDEDTCLICHGTGQMTESDSRLSTGYRYVPCRYCFMSSGKRTPPDFSGVRISGAGVNLVLWTISLTIGVALAVAFYVTVLEKQAWWPYVWKTGAAVLGVWLGWLGCKLLGWALDQVLRSPVWLVSLSLGIALYLHGAYATGLFTAAWQSVGGLALVTAGWWLLAAFIAPRFIVLAGVVSAAIVWSQT